MKRPVVLVFAWSVCLFPLMVSAQDTAVYTNSQAQQGGALYASQCAACHGAQLEGIAGPALTGTGFHQMAAVQHLTPKSLLDVVTTTMPMTAPGSLKPDQYASIVAFILQRSGYPAGDKPLSKDSANLASLDLGIDKAAGPSSATPAAATAMRLASQGVYTDAQMAQGKALYSDNCIQCHGGELDGVEDAPPLAGKPFLSKWGSLPVGALHAFIDKNMPPGNGGALGAVQEAAVLAYILSKNYFPAGTTPLPADPAGLNGIVLK
ncbi:MAG TPA: cytochrome c [Rhizomicrobium sp.]|nr:cytochrome c [Rhizomicrobium sp.]